MFLDFDKRMASVLVEMDVSLGLPSEVDILWGDGIFYQRLDYWNIPLCCHHFCDTGHMKNKCLHLLRDLMVSVLDSNCDIVVDVFLLL